MAQSMFRFKFITTAVFCSLLFSMVFLSCKKDEPAPTVDRSCLEDNIVIAQDLYDGTSEGTKPGDYVVGSRTAFKVTLDAAIAVNANTAATQADITNACAQLEAAITTYQSNLIKEIAAANLVGFWKMNGNANDSSGNGHDGALTIGHLTYGGGSVTPTTDRFGNVDMAYHFDHGGNIDIPYASALNPQQMSISLWAKKSTAGRVWDPSTYTMIAMNRWNGYKFQLQGGNLPFYTVKAVLPANADTVIYDRDDAGTPVDNDVWYHLVVTYGGDLMKFYINGILIYTWPGPLGENPVPGTAFSIASTPIDLVIGQDLPTSKYLTVDGDFQVAWGGFWTGDLDDVMLYNIALDAPQVASIYDNQSTP